MFGGSCFGELPMAAAHPRFASGVMTLTGAAIMRDPRLNILDDLSDILVLGIELYPKAAPDRIS